MKTTIQSKQHKSLGSTLAALLLAGSAVCLTHLAQADTPTVQTYNTAGPGTWTCPTGVSLVQVEVWGGGGGGGAGYKPSGQKNGGGGGGGGGAYARFNAYSVSPGQYSYNVGTPGSGGTNNSTVNASGTPGGDSWFLNSTILDAAGGLSGGNGTGASTAGLGSGGSGAGGGPTGDVQFGGGSGAAASGNVNAGGGGSCAGSAAGGNPASTYVGGVAVTGGGAGGNGGAASPGGPPTAGTTPGGGGGGARDTGGSGSVGTNGASGQVQFTYYATPTTQASGVSFSAIGSSSMTVSWTPGNVGSSLVIVSAGSAVTGVPVNGSVYAPNAAYGSGSQIGNGYVVYQGTGGSVPITGLAVGTTYYVAVYAVNGAGTVLAEFLTNTPATGSQATTAALVPSVSSPTKSAITTTTATLGATVTSANGGTISSYGVVWATTPNPTIANNKIQAGTSVTAPDTFTVGATGLPAGTTIYYAGYATSGAGTGYSPQDSFITLTNEPTVQASGASFVSAQGGGATVSWTRGNGADCIVLVSAGTAVNSAPVDGTTYTNDPDFGSGSEIGSGNYVAYLGTGTNVTLYALTPGTTYYVAVYELNGSGGSENYLTTSPATASGAAATAHPVVYYSGSTPGGDPTATSSWWTGTNGTGANPANFTSGDTFIIQAGDNYQINAGNTWAVNATTAGTAATVQINTNGTLTFDESTSGVRPILQLGGNMVQSVVGGLASPYASSVALVEFTSSGTWTGSGQVNQLRLDIQVDAGATLDASGLSDGFQFKQTNAHGLTVNSNAVLNVGTLQVNGNSSGGSAYFTLNDWGTLIEGRSSGQGVPGVFTGFNTNKVTLSTNANYVFDGTNAQITGTSANNVTMPATVNDFVFNNPAGVTLSQSTTVNGVLTNMANSTLDLNSNTLSVVGCALSDSGTLVMEFTRTGPNSFTGSQLTQIAGTLAFAGTLQVNATGPFLAGDQFQLFSAPAYSGNFTAVSGSPGAGLNYSFNPLTGVLSVASPVSTNAYLSSLTLNPALSFSPAFASNTTLYAASETYGSAPTVTVVDADLTATNLLITNGVSAGLLVSGTPSAGIPLTLGKTNVIAVLVTAQDGVTTNLYTVDVVEQPSQTVPHLTNSYSGSQLTLSWPADHLGYRLLVQTNNLSRGISTNLLDWGTVAGSTGITSTNIAVTKTGATNEFYRLVYP